VAAFDVDELIASCAAAQGEPQPGLAVREILERLVSRPADIDAALGSATSGGMRSLYTSPDLTILHIVWPPGVVLFPHDHRMWAANGIYGGAEDNTYFRRVADGIEAAGGAELRAGEVALLGPEAIHAVANPRRAYTAAIHVYGGDYFHALRSQWDLDGRGERPFDVDALHATLAAADDRYREG
jgi:predicted metal-dependent enzyme (double-stranded beta helix superfamily)